MQTCPLGTVWVSQIATCSMPTFVFGANGPSLWQLYDWNMDGLINVIDVQLMVNATLTGQLTMNNTPATLADVQATISAALNCNGTTLPDSCFVFGRRR